MKDFLKKFLEKFLTKTAQFSKIIHGEVSEKNSWQIFRENFRINIWKNPWDNFWGRLSNVFQRNTSIYFGKNLEKFSPRNFGKFLNKFMEDFLKQSIQGNIHLLLHVKMTIFDTPPFCHTFWMRPPNRL